MFTINHLVFKIVKHAHRNFPETDDVKKQLILAFKKKLALDFLLID